MKNICLCLALMLTLMIPTVGCEAEKAAAPTETGNTVVPTEPTVAPTPSSVFAAYADEKTLSTVSKIYAVSDSEYAMPVVLTTDGTVRNLKILSLTLSDIEGQYAIQDICQTIEKLTADDPIVVYLDFPGDLSAWGVSYVDDLGDTRYHTMYMSGEDGSLVLADEII